MKFSFTHAIATFMTSADSDLTAKEKQEGISALFDAITMIDISSSVMLCCVEFSLNATPKPEKRLLWKRDCRLALSQLNLSLPQKKP